jgi:hypothetical protein
MSSCAYLLTSHAVKRFRERVRPGLAWDAAESELLRLLDFGETSTEPPAWLADRQLEQAEMYLVIGDLVFPLERSSYDDNRWLAKTCIARGGISELARARRKHHRHERSRRGQSTRRARIALTAAA